MGSIMSLVYSLLIWFFILALTIYFLFKLAFVQSIAKSLLKKFLAWDTSRLAKNKAQQKDIQKMNQELFSSMEEVIEQVGGGPVLELGAGSCANLEHYPKGVRLMTIDLNENFKSYLNESLEKNKHVTLEKYLIGNVEDMSGLIADNSCSCVVSSLLLCCVQDQTKALNEIMRVLKPGGRFYFKEHIAAERGTWTRYAQETMNDTWAALRSNCNVTRNTDKVIGSFGFKGLTASIVYRPIPKMYFFAKKTYLGYADKPLT
ncbi:N6-adenosine-methyltransferase TMT1A-like isoform X1 [Hydractinia symbiolongicarpus]|uniref:N6-adenosine-methyltransferase TMT1A-like isoform X1 n=2 Tax=Hydractinia symbiolongicarpus TaxID=13093 RepID=UPI00254B2DCF|nr:N6-adenosine-methyltransferase TMT1A-like isoform X1 [Hydractinia symbiolongicarpus]